MEDIDLQQFIRDQEMIVSDLQQANTSLAEELTELNKEVCRLDTQAEAHKFYIKLLQKTNDEWVVLNGDQRVEILRLTQEVKYPTLKPDNVIGD